MDVVDRPLALTLPAYLPTDYTYNIHINPMLNLFSPRVSICRPHRTQTNVGPCFDLLENKTTIQTCFLGNIINHSKISENKTF